MAERVTSEDLDLLKELEVDTTPVQTRKYTNREQRIIAGFEEIERFVEENGRLPQHGEERDIFERLYATRLDQIRASEECREVLKEFDKGGLLDKAANNSDDPNEDLDDVELLASLGVEPDTDSDITDLVHVRPKKEIKAAEEVAQRTPCEDFDQFKPLFEQVQAELESGKRQTVKYKELAEIRKGDVFILDGQKVYVAAVGEAFVTDYGREDRRLRVIYDNGTENDLLLRSLQRALYKDKLSRRITEPLGGLFSDHEDDDDQAAGSIYVLRSKSDHPFVSEHRDLIHKIGVTGGDVKKRIANARKDPTYLLADVEVVANFTLANINRKKFEALLHKFFGQARLDIELKDRFDAPVEPKEWFLVPLTAIDEAIERIKDGNLTKYHYDPKTASIVPN